MCAITGIYNYFASAPEVSRDELRRIRDHMASRGPDGCGEWYSEDGRLGLGHRRLSIIDLSEAAAQPMALHSSLVLGPLSLDQDDVPGCQIARGPGGQPSTVNRQPVPGTDPKATQGPRTKVQGRIVVFNGEIYNYLELRDWLEQAGREFESHSDTEVLLHLYSEVGTEMFRYLRGMYAFAIWDDERRELLLARDPYGIKPLYYSDQDGTFRFASQVKALVAGGGIELTEDDAGLAGFYLFGSVPEPFTLYREIRALPAGHYLRVTPEGPGEPVAHTTVASLFAGDLSPSTLVPGSEEVGSRKAEGGSDRAFQAVKEKALGAGHSALAQSKTGILPVSPSQPSTEPRTIVSGKSGKAEMDLGPWSLDPGTEEVGSRKAKSENLQPSTFNLQPDPGNGQPSSATGNGPRATLKESVRAHLVSDVPVGVFLSSGIDSGAILGLASEWSDQPITAITLNFEEFQGTEEDETPLAAEVAQRYGARHVIRTVTKKEFEEELPKILEAMDLPSIDGVNSWFVAKAAKEAGLKVALSGLGGDELFGGYPSFLRVPQLARSVVGSIPPISVAGKGLRRLLAPLLALSSSASPKLAGVAEYGGTWEGAYLLQRGLFMPWELEKLMGKERAQSAFARLQPLELIRQTGFDELEDDHSRVACLESSLYMRNQLLRDSDWAGMAHSVEIRVPLVDAFLTSQLPNSVAGCPLPKSVARGPLPKSVARGPFPVARSEPRTIVSGNSGNAESGERKAETPTEPRTTTFSQPNGTATVRERVGAEGGRRRADGGHGPRATGHAKQILASAPSVPLPEAVLTRKKTGFCTPVRKWQQNFVKGSSEEPRRWARAWAKYVLTVARCPLPVADR